MQGQGRPNAGAASRAMVRLAVGHVTRSIETNESKLRGPNALAEGWQQFQIPIAGEAGSVIQWQTVPLVFAYAFHDATSQRDVPYNYPTFIYGAEIETSEPVIVSACVMGWTTTPQGSVVGAKIAVGAFDPTTNGLTNFTGFVHAMFQGFGALREVEDGAP